jgi:CheY-like chemotaxis protein
MHTNHSEPSEPSTYVVQCWKCDMAFDAMASPWCACDNALRTVICPRCATCSCASPLPAKRKFWNAAPRSLREHANRFRISHRTPAVTPAAGATPQVSHSDQAVPRILVVDDEEPMRSLVACYAEQLGYSVTTAADGDAALILLLTATFDVIITDALMPKMDGRELCRVTKQSQPAIKTVLLTSLYKSTRFKSEARHRFGVDEYLTKPLLFSDLVAVLARIAPIAPGTFDGDRTASQKRTDSGLRTPLPRNHIP